METAVEAAYLLESSPPQKKKESIKHLAQSLTSVPTNYTFPLTNLDPVIEEEIPTIDFSLLTTGSPYQRSKIIRDLGNACQDCGFFTVVNHGVSDSLVHWVIDACQGFFDLTENEKGEYAGKHVLDPIRYGTSFNPTAENVHYWRDFIKLCLHPVFHSPDKPAGFRNVFLEYSTSVRTVARELLRAIAESLGLEGACINKALELDSGLQLMAANFYPCCPQPELAMGMPPHSDVGLLTLLTQNDVGGLHVRHNGNWVHVNPIPNSFLVNIGDHMEIFSSGKYKSVLHRAVVNNKTARISIAMAHGPSLDSVVTLATELVGNENQRVAYRGMKIRDYLEMQQSGRLSGKSCLDTIRI